MVNNPIQVEDTVAIVVQGVENGSFNEQERASLIKVIGRRSARCKLPHTDFIFLLLSIYNAFQSLVYMLQAVIQGIGLHHTEQIVDAEDF